MIVKITIYTINTMCIEQQYNHVTVLNYFFDDNLQVSIKHNYQCFKKSHYYQYFFEKFSDKRCLFFLEQFLAIMKLVVKNYRDNNTSYGITNKFQSYIVEFKNAGNRIANLAWQKIAGFFKANDKPVKIFQTWDFCLHQKVERYQDLLQEINKSINKTHNKKNNLRIVYQNLLFRLKSLPITKQLSCTIDFTIIKLQYVIKKVYRKSKQKANQINLICRYSIDRHIRNLKTQNLNTVQTKQ
eukprot:TRINITY_DN3568_c0_g1_i3.p1 TRINITY_DN3568_c0_g1~~TRINITY_DN3568_c0_g1_i3.p1  ORF type:complete len:241 (+),score=-12.30 TRINITY_DN3568_c0_g1_i3:936-1658(+)